MNTQQVLGGLRARNIRLDGPMRGVVLGIATVIAYHHSLLTLVRNLALDTPLAYLGLVPVISAGLAYVAWRRAEPALPIHDRQVDFIVGAPLLLAALIMNLLLPIQLSTMYWVWRLDLLSMPMFVTGASLLLYGFRPTWRARWSLIFLFFAWPYPYALALLNWLDGFTELTISALSFVVRFIPVAIHVAGSGSRFALQHGAKSFEVSVATQCSGANSLVGFFLIGGAFMTLVDGSKRRRFAWIAAGAVVTWLLNVLRILMIFGVGRLFGERVAIDGFHPVLGLLLFNIGIGAMWWLLPKFGLQLGSGTKRGLHDEPEPDAVPMRKWRLALPVVSVFMVILSLANSGLTRYGLLVGDMGAPRLSSFALAPAQLSQWNPTERTNTYEWAKRFFGDDSTWNRFALKPGANKGGTSLWSSAPVIADVITGGSLTRLETWGLEACYNFHGYDVRNQISVDLGGGLKGTSLQWKDNAGPTWTVVSWHWPVSEKGKRRFERVTLLLPDTGTTKVRSAMVDFDTLDARVDAGLRRNDPVLDKLDTHNEQLRSFMIEMAREVVRTQGAAPTVKA